LHTQQFGIVHLVAGQIVFYLNDAISGTILLPRLPDSSKGQYFGDKFMAPKWRRYRRQDGA